MFFTTLFTKYDLYTFEQDDFFMDQLIILGFVLLEFRKLPWYESDYDILQPYFGENNIQIQYMDTDSVVLSVDTKGVIRDLKHLDDQMEFSKLGKNYESFSIKNKSWLEKLKKNSWKYLGWLILSSKK